MKIIEEKNKKTIFLDDNDSINIKTLKGNPITIKIECINGCLLIDEISSSKIKEMSLEQEQLEKLKQYNQNVKNQRNELRTRTVGKIKTI